MPRSQAARAGLRLPHNMAWRSFRFAQRKINAFLLNFALGGHIFWQKMMPLWKGLLMGKCHVICKFDAFSVI